MPAGRPLALNLLFVAGGSPPAPLRRGTALRLPLTPTPVLRAAVPLRRPGRQGGAGPLRLRGRTAAGGERRARADWAARAAGGSSPSSLREGAGCVT